MYEQYFGFREPPFRITPDPRFLYRTPCVDEAAAALVYGIEGRKGFISLVGEAGTGKTTLLRHVLDTLSASVRTVLVLHPTVEFEEILEFVLGELGIATAGGRKLVLLQRLQEHLLDHTRGGGNVALFIDEAQDLHDRVLEELRLLSNLETGTEKILQIVLAGQPELEQKLAAPGLRQLRQRIALHLRLRPLTPDELAAYVRTRLDLAGADDTEVFTPPALARVSALTQGIPRVVNVLCDAALLTAYAASARRVTPEIIDEAWTDYGRLVEPEPPPSATAGPARSIPPAALETPPTMPEAAPSPARPGPSRAPTVTPALELGEHVPLNLEPDEPVLRPAWATTPGLATLAILAALLVLVIAHGMRVWHVGPPAASPPTVAMQPPTPAPPPPAMAPAPVAAPSVAVAAPPPSVVGTIPAAAPTPAAPAGPPTATEARSLVHQFMLAYESLDPDRMAALFAADGTSDEARGTAAIRDAYARAFARLSDVVYTAPRIDVGLAGDRVTITTPFTLAYRQKAGPTGVVRGTARFEITTRDGVPRIVTLQDGLGA